eukprot:1589628-Rhodomonas_salina.1
MPLAAENVGVVADHCPDSFPIILRIKVACLGLQMLSLLASNSSASVTSQAVQSGSGGPLFGLNTSMVVCLKWRRTCSLGLKSVGSVV